MFILLGGMYLPKADSGRLVIGVWWIVVIVLVTTYSGNLVAFLTFPQFQPGIDYFFQIFSTSAVQQFGLRNGSYFEKYATVSEYRYTLHNSFSKQVKSTKLIANNNAR